jgi:transcriptional regulator with XRE-family HTH domain
MLRDRSPGRGTQDRICRVSERRRFEAGGVGQRTAHRRGEHGLDQQEVAHRAGLSRAYVSRLENGSMPHPKVDHLIAVADALRMPLDRRLFEEPVGDGEGLSGLLARSPWLRGPLADLLRVLEWAKAEHRTYVSDYIGLLAAHLESITRRRRASE